MKEQKRGKGKEWWPGLALVGGWVVEEHS